MNNNHINILMKFFFLLNNEEGMDVVLIGQDLVNAGADDLVNGGFWIWDINNNIEYYSPRFMESLGYNENDDFPFVPDTWQKMIDPEDLKVAFSNYEKTITSGGEHPYDQKVRYKRKDGSVIKLECSGSLIKKDGKPQALIGTHNII